jgi:predicted metalloprotease with PDZ domain
MSTRIRRTLSQFLAAPTLLIAIAFIGGATTEAQVDKVTIRVLGGAESHIVVEAAGAPRSVWSFRDSYAGMVGLGSRVRSLKAFAANGTEVTVRQIAPGQFEASAAAARFSYELSTAPPLNPSDASRISWVNEQRGLLMLRDILPTSTSNPQASATQQPLRLTLSLPPGWRAYSNDQLNSTDINVSDYDVAIIAIGSNLRSSSRRINGTTLTVVTDGQWSFTDSEAIDLAARVYAAHRATFASSSSASVMLNLYPFPRPTAATLWTAETRGATVTLLSGNLPSKVGALAQLSTPLTHELFHLWVPNALALEGDYDWFYEGFTVYAAARTAVRLDLLTFPEFVNAIARAYDGYLANAERERWSLIEASKRRWSAGPSAVYSESMVVAFLYDLRLRMQSRGKQSIEKIYPVLLQKYGAHANGEPPRPADGNDAAIDVLALNEGTRAFVRAFVTQPAKIDLGQELAPFGLKVETFGLRTRISVTEDLTKQQRDLLRQLGYNDVTRKRKN